MKQSSPSNNEIAGLLREIAGMLQAKGENIYRLNSYRSAARAVENSSLKIAAIARTDGVEGIRRVKGIGDKIGGLVEEFVRHGKVELRESLARDLSKDQLKEIAEEQKKSEHGPATLALPVKDILEIDREYREKAKAGVLKKIAPRLQNPEKKQWLPVMVKKSGSVKFTVMFSNTATAHQLGKTDDWVVVYYESAKGEGQCTVVTEQKGKRKGERVVRGREDE
ncbi:MAG TPA: helix-hairpin-helix domain-containing protein [Bacteroidota bacterium]|nr:helix-hairpin-helix domain-containing protein [Bacteroidota bacterium]